MFSVFVQEQADSRQHDKRGSQGPLGEEAEVLSVFCEEGFLRRKDWVLNVTQSEG